MLTTVFVCKLASVIFGLLTLADHCDLFVQSALLQEKAPGFSGFFKVKRSNKDQLRLIQISARFIARRLAVRHSDTQDTVCGVYLLVVS